ncbi:uncharacterized protein LACBIDRAFT_306901 [Laccaria bicolor S238N-H82]|uniref:Predicted protein n=1 Tax=Laccaria bicolor (strain S238N-H82 / ATCC MYA-4686) TaxID=486041 RepID=B0DNY8_LACBS|nr:uncharacterized protein LACBIDRAFT_306901 [Laccaria bicolor S238N-H82]EDR03811.1 predicted protein [Laccaria bicolor S238N-H82]|eukprot:XP_001885664.1 predicted protein [Laccaria bicolor S238N-H82]
MIARLHATSFPKPACAAATWCSPTARRRIPSSRSRCPNVQRLFTKHCSARKARLMRASRVPLAPKPAIINGAETDSPLRTLQLPRTLLTPQLHEVEMALVDPKLKGVTPEYVRERLSLFASEMLAGLSSLKAQAPKSLLLTEMDVSISNPAGVCPTHMLAVYSSRPTTTTTSPRKVTLFPTHQLVLAAHGANLPALPASSATHTSRTSATVAVVPLCLPAPAAFPLLQSYLYTKNAENLSNVLFPSSTSPLDKVALQRHMGLIHGLWADACALGVVDEACGCC